MIMRPRDYQQASIDALWDYWASGEPGDAVIEMATGLGKSVVLSSIIEKIARDYPTMRVMMLTHVKELIEQNYKAMMRLWPAAPAGIYSAGVGRRDTRQRIIFGGIQSVAGKEDLFKPIHLVVIDECHLVSPKAQTQYNELIRRLRTFYPQMKVIGLTATPYRLDTGSIIGPNGMFDDIVYKYDIGNGIRDGWLTPITSTAAPKVSIDTSKISIRGGEFVEKELIEAAGDPEMILAACTDMLKRVADRRGILVFCTGVAHAAAVADCLRVLGEEAECITGGTAKAKRARVIEDFKNGKIRFLTNANVLTTGFDATELSCVALMRPTLSTALYVQMVGRATRITSTINVNNIPSAEGRRMEIANSVKPNSLVLDYAGNLERHGPLNLVTGKKAKVARDEEAVGVVTCGNPDCEEKTDIDTWANNDSRCPTCNTKRCKHCKAWTDYELWGGENFDICPECNMPQAGAEADEEEVGGRSADHDTEAKTGELIADVAREKGWRKVLSWEARRHSKKAYDPNSIDTMRVDYFCQYGHRFSEWLCFDHPTDNYAYKRAMQWWEDHGGSSPFPESVDEGLKRFPKGGELMFVEGDADDLMMPKWIVVEKDGKWDRVVDRSFVEELNENRVAGALW